jgi:hypothetical protein
MKMGSTLASQGLITDVDYVLGGTGGSLPYPVPYVPRNPLGTIAWDDAGDAFIYLPIVASTTQGAFVTWHATTFATILLVTTANLSGPVAVNVSSAANLSAATTALGALSVTTTYGWFQLYGICPTAQIATASADGNGLWTTGIAGQVSTTAAAAKTVFGSTAVGASVSNVGACYLNWPFVEGTSTL